jgi:hypothetical protein
MFRLCCLLVICILIDTPFFHARRFISFTTDRYVLYPNPHYLFSLVTAMHRKSLVARLVVLAGHPSTPLPFLFVCWVSHVSKYHHALGPSKASNRPPAFLLRLFRVKRPMNLSNRLRSFIDRSQALVRGDHNYAAISGKQEISGKNRVPIDCMPLLSADSFRQVFCVEELED